MVQAVEAGDGMKWVPWSEDRVEGGKVVGVQVDSEMNWGSWIENKAEDAGGVERQDSEIQAGTESCVELVWRRAEAHSGGSLHVWIDWKVLRVQVLVHEMTADLMLRQVTFGDDGGGGGGVYEVIVPSFCDFLLG